MSDMPKDLNFNSIAQVPVAMLPGCRTHLAIQRKVEKNLLIDTRHGIGDQICTEPTLRYALEIFGRSGCEVSLAAGVPELFGHLKFKEVFSLTKRLPKWENYLNFNAMYPPTHIHSEFLSNLNTHCVDYTSLACFKSQLPISYRAVELHPNQAAYDEIKKYLSDDNVVIHAGKSYPVKTFPKDFWDAVIEGVKRRGKRPVLIGGNVDSVRSTVDVNAEGCIDLRNKISIMGSVALLKNSKVLLTNDSSPLHMAATGNAWIGFISTLKHPDYITHYRKNLEGKIEFGWRMQNHEKGGVFDLIDFCPNKKGSISFEGAFDEIQLRRWLPDADRFAAWAVEKASG